MWKDSFVKEIVRVNSRGEPVPGHFVTRHKPTGITFKEHVPPYRGDPFAVYLLCSGVGDNWKTEIHVRWYLMGARAREAGESCDDADSYGDCLDAFRVKYGEHYYIYKVGGADSHGKVPWNEELVAILAMLFLMLEIPWDDPDGELGRLVKLEFCPTNVTKKLHNTFTNLEMDDLK